MERTKVPTDEAGESRDPLVTWRSPPDNPCAQGVLLDAGIFACTRALLRRVAATGLRPRARCRRRKVRVTRRSSASAWLALWDCPATELGFGARRRRNAGNWHRMPLDREVGLAPPADAPGCGWWPAAPNCVEMKYDDLIDPCSVCFSRFVVRPGHRFSGSLLAPAESRCDHGMRYRSLCGDVARLLNSPRTGPIAPHR
jgi:hypothetical protein